MAFVDVLFSVLASGASLAASGGASEFGKGAGKAAFEALKIRLVDRHKVKTLPLLDDAAKNLSIQAEVKAELGKAEIAEDTEVLTLAAALRQAIEALPAETQARYAVNIETIRAGGNLLFDAVQGVKATLASSKDDMTFRNIKAPPGK